MSLFIPFKPHHQMPVKFQGKREPELPRKTSQDSIHSDKSNPDTNTNRLNTPRQDGDFFRQAKRSRTLEDLNAITLPGKNGELPVSRRLSDLDAWLNRGEHDDLLELITSTQHKEDRKSGDKSAAHKPNIPQDPRHFQLTSQLLDEEGGSSFTSFLLHNPAPPSPKDRLKPEPKAGSQDNPITIDSPLLSETEELAAARRKAKRKHADYLH